LYWINREPERDRKTPYQSNDVDMMVIGRRGRGALQYQQRPGQALASVRAAYDLIIVDNEAAWNISVVTGLTM
jgi:hypothetical protein